MNKAFLAVKEFCLSSMNPKQLFGINNHPDYKNFAEQRLSKGLFAIFNLLICWGIICLLGKQYIYYLQEPICRQSPGQVEPYSFIWNWNLIVLIGLIAAVLFSVYMSQAYLRLLHWMTYIPAINPFPQYIFKLWYMMIVMFLLSNFVGFIFTSKHILGYEKQEYSYCHFLISAGKETFDINEKAIIKSAAVEQISGNILLETKQKKKINFFEGTSGVGKSTAIQYVINQILKKSAKRAKKKQTFIYYTDFENLNINKKSLYQFSTSRYSYPVQKLFNKYFTIKEQKKLFKIQQQLRYLSKRAKVIIIFDGVNKVKSNKKFITYLESFAQIFLDQLDFHLFLCSSQYGLQIQYDEKFSFLRSKYSILNVVPNQTQKQLKEYLYKLISSSKIHQQLKNKIKQEKQKIISLCYGFGQLYNLFKKIQHKISISNVDQIIQQQKKFIYRNSIAKIQKNIKYYKKEICAILNGNQTIIISDNIKMLQSTNILFSDNQFYSKITQMSFRENYPYCQQKQKTIPKKNSKEIKIQNDMHYC